MENLIVIAVILLLVGAAVVYIIKEKKRGTKCIGCPAAGQCAKRNGGGSCSSKTK